VRWQLLLGIVLAGLAVAVTPGEPAGARRATSRELPLLTIAELGKLSWTCDTHGGPQAVWFRASPSKATEVVHISSGSGQRTLTLQPGGALSLRMDNARRARVSITQATEARTLRAAISLGFLDQSTAGYCLPYFPPAVTLSLRS
jgi:hypothetical protein